MSLKNVVVQGYQTQESMVLEPTPIYVDTVDPNMSVDNKSAVMGISVSINGLDGSGSVYVGNGNITGSAQFCTENGIPLVLEGDSVNIVCSVTSSTGLPLPSVTINCKISSAGQSVVKAE